MMSDLYSKTYHTNKYTDYLINIYITEYDIRRAGPTALLIGGCINRKQFDWLCSLPRNERQRQTGMFERNNPGFTDIKKQIITEARKVFIESNEFDDGDILSIKNDAVYVIKKQPKFTVFKDILEFVPKNIYTSYYRYNRTEMYYYAETHSTKEYIDIKNISDDKLVWHKNYFLDFLSFIFNSAQTTSIQEVIGLLQHFMQQYINLDLDLGYYREFNARSDFKFNIAQFTDFYGTFIPENTDKHLLDINYNLGVLRFLFQLYSNIYFNSRK